MSVSTAPTTASGLYADPRVDWLAQYAEEVIDPKRPIVDPHHHLWDRGGQRYLIEELSGDIASGHNIIATVYVEARSMYRTGGPEAFRPVGEVEFANGAAAIPQMMVRVDDRAGRVEHFLFAQGKPACLRIGIKAAFGGRQCAGGHELSLREFYSF